MFIKSVVIDGFKSYGKRVDVKDFDKEFNAITGLSKFIKKLLFATFHNKFAFQVVPASPIFLTPSASFLVYPIWVR